jgi:hypothetical protein
VLPRFSWYCLKGWFIVLSGLSFNPRRSCAGSRSHITASTGGRKCSDCLTGSFIGLPGLSD